MNPDLSVWVNGCDSGRLFREEDDCFFRYQSDAAPDSFVSLTMPVRTRDYVHHRLHPIFEMHLPEGYLLSLLKKHFSKLAPTDDLGLLRLLSGSVRGRLQYGHSVSASSALSLEDVLHSQTAGLFDELVSRFALQSPLSGVQPKVLARLMNKATLKLDDFIVKAWGPDYPQLALNEYWCMKAVERAGIPVPSFYCSDDAALFVMRRFDLRDKGEPLGFEDLCVLQARTRDDKYEGSYEQVAKSISLFVSPTFKTSSLQQFFKMMVMNTRLQNGDAHLKNFGVLYEDARHVWLAPAYDVVSTTAYIANDVSALTLMGSRKWWSTKHLLRFGVDVCGLSLKQAGGLYDECVAALSETAAELEKSLGSTVDEEQIRLLEHLLKLMR